MSGKEKHKQRRMQWVSPPTKFVFTWQKDYGMHFPWGYEVLGKKTLLIFVEKGKQLYFHDPKGESGYRADALCFFCEYAINLGRLGYSQTCLQEKNCCVDFCPDFSPGPCFGDDKERDMGKRRETAEKLFPKLVWHLCGDCEHWNNKNVYRISEDGNLYENRGAAFCEVLGRRPECGYYRTCRSFEVTHVPEKQERFFARKKKLEEYIEELKVLEKQRLINSTDFQ